MKKLFNIKFEYENYATKPIYIAGGTKFESFKQTQETSFSFYEEEFNGCLQELIDFLLSTDSPNKWQDKIKIKLATVNVTMNDKRFMQYYEYELILTTIHKYDSISSYGSCLFDIHNKPWELRTLDDFIKIRNINATFKIIDLKTETIELTPRDNADCCLQSWFGSEVREGNFVRIIKNTSKHNFMEDK